MDWNEVYMILSIIEKATAHGTPASHIRTSAMARLTEIEEGLKPVPPEPVYPKPDEPVEEPKEPEHG